MQATQTDTQNFYRSPQGYASVGMQKSFMTESKTAGAPGIPVLSQVSGYFGSDILAHRNKTQIDLYKNIIKSEGSNDFIQNYGMYKHNSMAVASYIGTMAVEAVQFGMQHVDSPASIREVLRLNTLLSRIQGLNYTEEDSVEIAYIIDNYKQEIAWGGAVGVTSRETYDRLNEIFEKASRKDKEDFLSNSKDFLETIIDPALIVKTIAHGGASAVDSLLNMPYRLWHNTLGDEDNEERVHIIEDLAESMFNISKRDLRKIQESRAFRILHALPGIAGLGVLGGTSLRLWTIAKEAGFIGLVDYMAGANLSTLHEKFGMSAADFDAVTTGLFIGGALITRQHLAQQSVLEGNYNFNNRKGIKFDLFEGENPNSPSPTSPKNTPKNPNSPSSTEIKGPEVTGENIQNVKETTLENANPDVLNVKEFDTSGDTLMKTPVANQVKFDNYQAVSQRAYVDSNSMTVKDGGLIEKLSNLKEDIVPIEDTIKRTQQSIEDVLKDQNFQDPEKMIIGFNDSLKEAKKSMVNTMPDTEIKSNYVANLSSAKYGKDAPCHLAALHEGNTFQLEAIEEAMASGSSVAEADAVKALDKLNRSLGDHYINEAIGDCVPYAVDEHGVAINYEADTAEFASHSPEVKKNTMARFADDMLDSIRDTTTQGYELFQEAETKYKQMLEAGINSKQHKDFVVDLLVKIDKEVESSGFGNLFSEVASKSKNRKVGPRDLQSMILNVDSSPDGLIRVGSDVVMPLELLFDIRSTAQKMKSSRGFIKSGEWRLYNGLSNIINDGIESYFNFIQKTEGFENFSSLREIGDKKYRSVMQSLNNAGIPKSKLIQIAENPSLADVYELYGKKDKITKVIIEHGLLDKSNYLDKMSGAYMGSTNLPRSFNAFNASFRLEGLYETAFSKTDGLLLLNNKKMSRMHNSQWFIENGRMLTASERKIFDSILDMSNTVERAHQRVLDKVKSKKSHTLKNYGGAVLDKAKEFLGIGGKSVEEKLRIASDPVMSWAMFLGFIKKVGR